MYNILDNSGPEFGPNIPKQRHKLKTVDINFTLFTGKPDSEQIKRTVVKHEREGWRYVGKRHNEGLFGFGAHTRLTFAKLRADQQLASPQSRADSSANQGCCLATLLQMMIRLAVFAFVAYVVVMLLMP